MFGSFWIGNIMLVFLTTLMIPLLAAALTQLGVQRALVVCGEDGLDEVTLASATHVSEVRGGQVREFQWTPADCNFEFGTLEGLQVDGPQASAAMIRAILDGRPGPPRDIVVLNAAAALWTAGKAATPREAAKQAAAAIDTGAARDLLARLAELSSAAS